MNFYFVAVIALTFAANIHDHHHYKNIVHKYTYAKPPIDTIRIDKSVRSSYKETQTRASPRVVQMNWNSLVFDVTKIIKWDNTPRVEAAADPMRNNNSNKNKNNNNSTNNKYKNNEKCQQQQQLEYHQ
uniref:Uncharacterized protein n=1 Tax=Glossina palpalis gambiensis TaxID=67801 RepID=A0A1B0ATD6_9MUSC